MKTITIIFLFLIAGITFSQAQPAKDSIVTINKPDRTNIGVSNTATVADTLNISIVSEPTKTSPFLPVLLGTFFGALCSGLVAYYSIKRTHKNSLEIERQRTLQIKELHEKQYSGFVFAIYVTMKNLENAIRKTKSQLDSVEEQIISAQSFVVTDVGATLSLSFISELTHKFIGYENYNTQIAGVLISFIHSAENYNLFTRLDQIANVLDRVKDANRFISSVKSYFDNLREHLTKLDDGGKKITAWCIDELKKSPYNNLIESAAP